ncbi:RusA family crossover junction endodeoxyribonuclease [Enterobacter cloacae]|uniref:RusA family crossover junction endodeoxyribonuclease n=1 Tax=Enterobacter cloacae TaxID=550 RepID=UPI00300DA201
MPKYIITPVGKPRMTRRDKWKQRPPVMRYRMAMDGQPHQQKPDLDNLKKSLLDALFEDDSHIWDARTSKVWGEIGMIIIEDIR